MPSLLYAGSLRIALTIVQSIQLHLQLYEFHFIEYYKLDRFRPACWFEHYPLASLWQIQLAKQDRM